MKLIQKNNINYNLNSFQYLLRPQAKKTLTGLEHIKYLRRLHAKSNFYLIEVRVFTLNVAYFRRKMARFYKNFKKYELLTSIKFLPKANKNLQTILRGPVHDKKTRIQLWTPHYHILLRVRLPLVSFWNYDSSLYAFSFFRHKFKLTFNNTSNSYCFINRYRFKRQCFIF